MAKVDSALDDIVKQNREKRRSNNVGKRRPRGGRGQANSNSPRKNNNRAMTMPNRNGGGARNNFNNPARSRSVLSRSKSLENIRRSDDGITRLCVRNLDYAVNDKDMRELFNEFGTMKRAEVHYDRDGRSQGTAELTFMSKRSALSAKKQYNGVPLDGRAMEIEIIGDKFVPQLIRAAIKERNGFRRNSRPTGTVQRRTRTNNKDGRVKKEKEEKKAVPTAEELDKELDNYLTEGAKTDE